MEYPKYAKKCNIIFLVFFYSFSINEVIAQSDSLVYNKLDSLIKLSNKQIKLLNPINSEEYKKLENDLELVKDQRNDFKSEKIKLEGKLRLQSENNINFASALADSRLTDSQISAINSWSQSQKTEIPSVLTLSIQISKRLDEIDLGLAKAPDSSVVNSLLRNLNFLKQNKSGLNQKTFLVKEMDKYILSIPQYFKSLQEFEKLCDGITESIVKSTVIDIMSVYKFDLASYPFLRGAFYYSVDYPNSMPFRQDFLWFLNNQIQIPNSK